jgi:hypothetical protein
MWLVSALLIGCATTREQSKTPRTAIEQLLLSEALERSLAGLSVPLPTGASVVVETAGLSGDQSFVRKLVEDRLGAEGMLIREKAEDAGYLVRVIVQTLGTEQDNSFFGMPPVQSGLLPFALPELAVYDKKIQYGVARVSLALFERATGRLIIATRLYEGTASYKQYVLLFFIGFRATDLRHPP